MSNSQEQLLGKKIQEFIGTTPKECYYFYGAGQFCKFILDWFTSKNIPLPAGICDNNASFHGKSIDGVSVISFEQALSITNELKVIITDLDNSSTIEQQLLRHIDKSQVFDLSPYIKKIDANQEQPSTTSTHISKAQANFEAMNKRYTDGLRGLNNEKFLLKKPEDMPEHAKQLAQQLKAMKEAYLRGENFYVDKEKTMLAQDLFSRGYYKGVRRLEGYQGHLIEQEMTLPIRIDISKSASNVYELSNYLNKKDTPFLFMQLPCKLKPNACDLPEHIVDYVNPFATNFLNELHSKGVNTLDYRQVMLDNNIDFLDSFFKTDSHWTPRASFKATKNLCEEIQKLIDIDIDWQKLELDNYNTFVYENIMLGGCGKTSDLMYSGLDDFELILPKFQSEYTWNVPAKKFIKHGSHEEALLYPLHLDWNYGVANPYGVYSMAPNFGYTIIKNHMNKSGLKALFLRDSFVSPMSSFIMPQFSECHFLDLRGTLKNLFGIINSIKPDIVAMLYTTYSYGNIPIMTHVNPKDFPNS